jgi:hypothetical protein
MKQKGYTILQLFVVLWTLFVLCLAGGGLYAIGHFIAKFW